MKGSSWMHSPAFHGLLVTVATLISFAIAWLIDALHAGTIHLTPGLAVYAPLAIGLLTIIGVALRDWLEGQHPVPPPAPPGEKDAPQ